LLYVERSNRTEKLLAGLADRLTSPRPDPLSPSLVVVQGQGMERWIAQSIARDHGVCANTTFVFPRNLIDHIFGQAFGKVSEPVLQGAGERGATDPGGHDSRSRLGSSAINPRWEMDSLVWAVARRIIANESAPELAPLARQLQNPDKDWRLIQLAQQIAGRFDDYITYRPDWVARWTTAATDRALGSLGPDEAWQAWLFRGLVEDLGPGHLADRTAQFLDLVGAGDDPDLVASFDAAFRNGVEVFAISTLPPLYLSILDGLAQLIDVRLSVLSPSRQYWADLWSEVREDEEPPLPLFEHAEKKERAAAMAGATSASSVAGLLSGLGRLGSDFQRALEEVSGYVELEPSRFEGVGNGRVTDDVRGDAAVDGEAAQATLLRRLQLRMLDLDESEVSEADRRVARDDRSIRVHRCHGPKRELEVVEAALREAFERDPTLTPEDVIVMAPKIDELVPTIDAVFGASSEESAGSIPYRIADRSTLHRSPVAEAFVALLRLLTGRATRTEILDWLSLSPAHTRLGLDTEGVERLGEWAVRAGVRFGLDESHRDALGLEASRRHTWAGAIDRLVLGHALGQSGEIVGTLAPEPLDRFSDASLLGAIGDLEATLSRARRELRQARSVDDWARWLTALLGATLDHHSDNTHEHGLLRTLLQRMATSANQVDFDHRIPFEAMRERFERAIDAASPAQGFLSGGVTFCELVPLRAIPFRVVAIIGLSDTNFPRRQPAASYDLIARHPRTGDRNGRSDDRYLFLEALLSTRDQLILTVPSRDLRDGSELPPSVVVSELLDTLDASFVLESADARATVGGGIVVDHPMHSFSPRYFDADGDARLIGLDAEAFEGARAHVRTREEGGEERRFLDVVAQKVEPAPDPKPAHLALEELTERVLRSTRLFARERLRLQLPRPERAVADLDPVGLDPLDVFGLGDALLADRRAGASASELAPRLATSSRLPVGEPGRLASRALTREVNTIFEIAATRFGGADRIDQSFELSFDGIPGVGPAMLSGVIRDLTAVGPIRLEFSRSGGRGELAFWIQHLVVCALADEGADLGTQSVIVSRPEVTGGQDRVAVFSYVSDARSELETLFEWASSVERAPLPFFPKTSRVFADHRADGKDDQAWNAAHQKFYGGDSNFGLRPEFEEDLENARTWEGSRPLEPDHDRTLIFRFDAVADRFFHAYREAREVFER
jgi:exodeoxyribonuclease V gamma subunit